MAVPVVSGVVSSLQAMMIGARTVTALDRPFTDVTAPPLMSGCAHVLVAPDVMQAYCFGTLFASSSSRTATRQPTFGVMTVQVEEEARQKTSRPAAAPVIPDQADAMMYMAPSAGDPGAAVRSLSTIVGTMSWSMIA